jgi:hypothetical protein
MRPWFTSPLVWSTSGEKLKIRVWWWRSVPGIMATDATGLTAIEYDEDIGIRIIKSSLSLAPCDIVSLFFFWSPLTSGSTLTQC